MCGRQAPWVWAREEPRARTQVAVHDFAVVHLPPGGADPLQLVFLGFHSLLQLLELLVFRHRLLLAALLLLQEMQTLLLTTRGDADLGNRSTRGLSHAKAI